MKASELRELSIADLKEKLVQLRRDGLNLRIQKVYGSQNQNQVMLNNRKEIARIKTILTEKECRV